ncbi:DUF2239 family protein [Variovorax sp. N23]|uniref:DUF2239 family protein n=1 Tax=Variovorax sp. N23 TaxID=2980555 RepID=UPI0021C75730|nr:DUF2239 family protein [Variovorax sp. N23]MCU4118577.1 DUF2239 family protein [Variovorax sp. N23]
MPTDTSPSSLTAFADSRRIATGTRDEVIAQLRRRSDASPVFVFDDVTGEPLDLDLRDSATAVGKPVTEEPAARAVGRPKLGVVAREVTLLPRHWDWLNRQPGGASVALRKLVEDARRVNAERDTVRASREAAYRFMSAIAGHSPGFEEASRALFAGEQERFESLVASWPDDVRTHLHKLADAAWSVA